jgi:hypothetical protein
MIDDNRQLFMKRNTPTKSLILAFIAMAAASVAHAGSTVTVDPAAMNHGYMNVFDLPASGVFPASAPGTYRYGSGWGLADLVSAYSMDPSSTTNIATLAPNNINNPDPYWYVGGGADGNPGNKIMDANLYAEYTGVYVNQNLTFSGVVYSNVLLQSTSTNQLGHGWTCYAFIKDYAGNYGSYTTTNLLLTNTGPFSITLLTSADPGHHIQWGFETFGPDVWPSDPILAGLGNVQVGAVVFAVPVISLPPAPTKAVLGNSATFSVGASGNITGYQWKTNGVNLPEGNKYSGTQTSALTISDCAFSDAIQYSVTVTGPGGSVSATNALTVIDPNKITVNPADAWLGYMNWTPTPQGWSPGGGGNPWGTADLNASFAGAQLRLSPNTINDANCYWYYNPDGLDCGTAGSRPGAVGAKLMDANMYVETTDLFRGAAMSFSGTILNTNLLDPSHTNSEGNGWTCTAFIKDFAPDYSSSVITRADLATNAGTFNISYTTMNDVPGRHVQWGFETIGPDVWHSDPILASLGNIVVAPYPHITVTASVTGTTLNLSFPSVTGYGYTVQYKNNITDATWTTLTTRSGTGSIITVTDSTSSNAHRFYRVAAH